jgi:3-dehydroquinate dehydratase type I
LAEDRPRICAVVVNSDLEAIKKVEPMVDLFELRIDLIGSGWQEVAGHLKKPWLVCNRRAEEGGGWRGSELERIKELLSAVGLGARILDIELSTPGVEKIVGKIKGKAECLVSYHNLKETPPLEKMQEIIKKQMAAGADICKVVTTARTFADNVAVLRLIADFPEIKVVSFAMDDLGQISRILCPLVGGYFTYASIEEGRESAEGQITVGELREIYKLIGNV